MTCNLKHPMHLRHPVSRITWFYMTLVFSSTTGLRPRVLGYHRASTPRAGVCTSYPPLVSRDSIWRWFFFRGTWYVGLCISFWCVTMDTYMMYIIYTRKIYMSRVSISCFKLQVIFLKRATNYRALLRKKTYNEKASTHSTPMYIVIIYTCKIYMSRVSISFWWYTYHVFLCRCIVYIVTWHICHVYHIPYTCMSRDALYASGDMYIIYHIHVCHAMNCIHRVTCIS